MTTTRIALVAVLSLATTPAWAGGFASARFGGEHGHPASDHPTSLYFNPAGLALGSGSRVYAEGLFVWRSVTYNRPQAAIDNPGAGTPDDALAANAGRAELMNFLVSPFLGVTTDAGVENLGLGLAVYAPFGGQSSWKQNNAFEGNSQYPGALDGVQRWSTIDGSLRVLYLTVGGAYRIPGPRLSFGVGLNLIRQSIETLRAREASGTDDLVSSAGTVVEGRSLIEASGFTFSAGIGANFEAVPDMLWIGLSYQSQPGFGETAQQGTLTNKFGAGEVDSSPIEFLQELPDVVRLGVRYRPTDELELRLSGDYTRWSVLEDHCLLDADVPNRRCRILSDGSASADSEGIVVNVRRDWQDTFGARAGGSYQLTPELELGGSVAYDSNAVPDETIDAALLDMDKLIFSAGGVLGVLGGDLSLALAYTQVVYFRRTVRAPTEPFELPSRAPSGAGTYRQMLGFVTLGAGYRF